MDRDRAELDARRAALERAGERAVIQAWFALGGDYDSAGFEEDAMRAYDRVFAIGAEQLRPEQQPQLYLQAGSTLRNLERPDEARALFEDGRRRFPQFHALAAFQALLEISDGRNREANLLLLDCLAAANDESGSLARYRRSLIGYTEALRLADSRTGRACSSGQ